MENEPAPPASLRQLGRPRTYTPADVPERLIHWHAPRANRWEHLCVTAGRLDTQWLGPCGSTTVWLCAGDNRWIGPGTRWRVARMEPDTHFELQTHAADALPIGAPQPLRAVLLDAVECVQVDDGAAFTQLIAGLTAGETRLLRGRFECAEVLRTAIVDGGRNLFWHPLYVDAEGFTAFIARSAQPIELPDYLGRDHAVIEAALAGALRGDAEHARWLQTTLARHLAIEEKLLFPAYLDSGGRELWIRGLTDDHALLRQNLPMLSSPGSRRRFLLLLDGHDEREEEIVYPDILARLGAGADDLTCDAMLYPPPEERL